MKCSSCGGDCIPISKIDEAIEQIRNTSYRGAAVKILEDLKK